ncbi:Holliday junction resolvase RuvX [Candidatus Neptunochlamydia vexilliferae]|uniref:Holliday junction resolvase RuvX n=1 Tax=Candidatus Neptunichlamydia vexilliferae TaxID=1651774 RepID=UPI001890CEB0|nr:Holliday junction resolvase RuvX [Candidatus Neptunochlamydia vexilliferae]
MAKKTRVLGIDFGMKRIGLARSDLSRMIASPLKTILAAKTLEGTVDLILKELDEVDTIVMGLPLLLSGKDSETTTTVRKFATLLEEASGLPLILWDERLTSKQVERLLMEDKMSRKKRAAHVDTMSATLILQNYLDSLPI